MKVKTKFEKAVHVFYGTGIIVGFLGLFGCFGGYERDLMTNVEFILYSLITICISVVCTYLYVKES